MDRIFSVAPALMVLSVLHHDRNGGMQKDNDYDDVVLRKPQKKDRRLSVR